ncbi:hypothetical protein NE865_15926 [Phthorimaea operculella]|nr:hypothetical protein NE865_15926 [Phthorimaea operculella]
MFDSFGLDKRAFQKFALQKANSVRATDEKMHYKVHYMTSRRQFSPSFINKKPDNSESSMEAPCSRFTAAEGGARLAATASTKNTLAVEYASFISTRMIYEDAYKIRGLLSAGKQRSLYVTRASMVDVVAYELNILTDLKVSKAVKHQDVEDWTTELEEKEVLVCTSVVLRRLLEDGHLRMPNINVLVVDSSHLIARDPNLQYIMKCYKECQEEKRPRILALTYPLFSYPKKDTSNNNSTEVSTPSSNENLPVSDEKGDSENLPIAESNENLPKTGEMGDKLKNVEENLTELQENLQSEETTKEIVESETTDSKPVSPDLKLKNPIQVEKMGVYENLDDFDMYEKLEWKIEQLENELCCEMDLAEDIDGGKRLSATLTKPMEVLVEHNGPPDSSQLPPEYVELEQYMRNMVGDAVGFLDQHRYDPTEIYGEDLYEEFMNIPNPVIEPKQIFNQFLYVLDELGPYAADKAAFSLLTKLEKLKIKVPYERHFLLLCLCTTVFVKIRCFADLVFSKYESDWEKIKTFCTPKVLRFAEILEKFCPENYENLKTQQTKDTKNNESVPNEENKSESKTSSKTNELLEAIEKCDFISLSNKIEDKVNTYEANLKELDEVIQSMENETDGEIVEKVDVHENISELGQENQNVKNEEVTSTVECQNPENTQNAVTSNPQSPQKTLADQKGVLGLPRRPNHRNRGRGRTQRPNQPRHQQQNQNPDSLCGIVFMKEPLMAKIMFMLIVDMSRSHPKLSYLCSQYCCAEQPADRTVPSECQRQNKKQEDVLKKFRMHECNLLLATSALEEGIDLPRCNLVLRWDVPASYRSYGLCRSRARAPRATCALLTKEEDTNRLLHNVAVYRELDQIISRKCGCGIQDEPPQSEEDHADSLTHLVKPYAPSETATSKQKHNAYKASDKNTTERVTFANNDSENTCDKIIVQNHDCKNTNDKEIIKHTDSKSTNDEAATENCDSKNTNDKIATENIDSIKTNVKIAIKNLGDTVCPNINVNNSAENKKADKLEDSIASVDLSTAIALINRYCGKLPSDTFTRLAPQWWIEEVQLPVRNSTEKQTAYVCTLRLPLNCPVKHNIVGHPMPTKALARRMAALQACRILHRNGELDDQLMPIGKEGFKAAELDSAGNFDFNDPNDSARRALPNAGSITTSGQHGRSRIANRWSTRAIQRLKKKKLNRSRRICQQMLSRNLAQNATCYTR